MTKADLYALIDDIVKVNSDATDTTKLQGARHRVLLKTLVDFITNGGAAGDFPFDWQTPSNAFGGYYNNETTFAKGMVKFLHRDTGPSSSLSADNPDRERGYDSSVTLHYAVNPGTYSIKTIDVGNDHFTNPTLLVGTSSASTTANTDTQFQLTATDQQNNSTTSTATVRYYDKRYAFSSTTNLFALSDKNLSLLLHQQSGELSKDRYLTQTVNCNNSELYVAFPASYGTAKMILNTFEDNSFTINTFSYTNSQGFASQYVLYKSGNKLFGDYTISVQ